MSNEIMVTDTEQSRAVPVEIQNENRNGNAHESLFATVDAENFRLRWREIQGDFVDEPRQAVEKADQLVARIIEELTNGFSRERTKLEQEWSQGKDVSTEDLRQALRRYRSFFDRLLTV